MSAGALLVAALAAPVTGQATEHVSVDSGGLQGNDESAYPSISADSRYVAFRSAATNLVSGDTNGFFDVFVRDRSNGTTERVSVDSSGGQGNEISWNPSISADGRYVAFESLAANLVSADTNGTWDVFVHDRWSGTTERMSVDSFGAQGNGSCGNPSISADGRHVAFSSGATNLTSGDTNGTWDVFIRDRSNGTTARVSVDSFGAQGNGSCGDLSISADGRYVTFQSLATNLVSADTNWTWDIFVNDRSSGTTERVSVDSGGAQGNEASWNPSISANGRYVAFGSLAANLVSGDTNGWSDIFVRDRWSGTTERASVSSGGAEGDRYSSVPSIAANGRYVAFYSFATNLVSADTNGTWDVFVHDRWSGTTGRVSVDSFGAQGNDLSGDAAISADGRHVAFTSLATNLVSGDANSNWDVFVRDRGRLIPHVRRR